ncbi:low temperature requirement protein A [Micromonospora purpureochromogenes]|uniref:Low temperature requirement protein LtrA n=1 Tax=Micromonospora purpureochromogenes TaxID=47872 RepID=A0ABX2RQ68_9ACTN|nr:low temperature requirement protein A [Micromonospora purpureochromogenes]NYF57419.1 low temperature requirement protein LtrA [Micromonospora purpureochromogenes]
MGGFGRIELAGEGDGVSRLELFVDLVFVYAFLNVTGVISEQFNPAGVPRGLLILVLLWWCWVRYAGLGSAVRLDRGFVPALIFAGSATLLVMSLTVREAFGDQPGGLSGPLVFAVGYALVQGGGLALGSWARWSDPGSRQQFRRVWLPAGAGIVLLLAGALVPSGTADDTAREWIRFALVGAAVLVEYVGFALVGVGSWRIRSITYWAERHGLIILIAFGETILSVGLSQGAAIAQPLTWPVIAGVLLSVMLVGTLWWTYFDVARFAAEQALHDVTGPRRTLLARDAYSYLHLPMVGGLILVSLGLKYVLGELRVPSDRSPTLGLAALYGGVVLYLAGLIAFELRTLRLLGRSPILGVALVVAAAPLAAGAPVLAKLALVAAATAAMALSDVTVFRHKHRRLHAALGPAGREPPGVTPKELFFDLVFVYAFLQVAAVMAEDPRWPGLLRGLLVLTVLWWAWAAYAWLSNTVRAETPAVRGVMLLAVAVTAVITIAIPQAFNDAVGGLSGPVLFVGCYAVIRLLHLGSFWAVTRAEPALRGRVLPMAVPTLTALALLIAAALVPEPVGDVRLLSPVRAGLWLLAIAIDLSAGVALLPPPWRIPSASHCADRYSLIVIIALGEAVISMGAAVMYTPISLRIVVASALGTALLAALWWWYFDVDSTAGEHALDRAEGARRTTLARIGYGYLHLPMIAGIVLVSLGLRTTMSVLGTHGLLTATPPLRWPAHLALFGGVALFLLADQLFWWRLTGGLRWIRAAATLALLALIPLTVGVGPLLALALLVAACLALILAETLGAAPLRQAVRH